MCFFNLQVGGVWGGHGLVSCASVVRVFVSKKKVIESQEAAQAQSDQRKHVEQEVQMPFCCSCASVFQMVKQMLFARLVTLRY